jgi:hypothetical protein
MAHKVWTSALTVCYLLWRIKKWKIEVLEFDFSLIWKIISLNIEFLAVDLSRSFD